MNDGRLSWTSALILSSRVKETGEKGAPQNSLEGEGRYNVLHDIRIQILKIRIFTENSKAEKKQRIL